MAAENKLVIKEIAGPFKIGNVSWVYFYQHNEEHSLYLTYDENVEFTFSTSSDIEIEELFVNTNSLSLQWAFIQLKKVAFNHFSSTFKFNSCGLFHFKIIYKIKNDEAYSWDNRPFTTLTIEPNNCHNLSIYTYIPNVSGKFSDWIKDFNKIKLLGFNTIHLLPFIELDTSQSPYAAKDLFHVDPYYFDTDNKQTEKYYIDALVKNCQNNKIKLCLDLVFNHVGVNSNICQSTPHWLQLDPTELDGLKRAGYWFNDQWIKWNDVVLIDFDHPNDKVKREIWDYMISYSLFWSEIASRTNGMIRLDNLHSTNFLFAEKVIAEIKNKFPHLIIQAELFAYKFVVKNYMSKGYINLLLTTPWLSPYASDIRIQLKNIHRKYVSKRFIFSINSHDSQSAVELYGSPQAIIPRYASAALMSTGCTGLTQGTEYGINKKLSFVGYQPRVVFNDAPEICSAITKINQIKSLFKTFQTGGNIEFIDNDNPAILACIRFGIKFNESDFLIIANFNANSSQDLTLNLKNYHTKYGRDLFTNEIIPLQNLMVTSLHLSQIVILEIQN